MPDQKASIRFIEKLYTLYEQKMYQAAYRILHDSWLAEDAVQEAFINLMKHSIYFEDAESEDCKRYIITVIKHSSITIYNKKKREQEILYLTDEGTNLQKTSLPDDTETDIEDLISRLPEKYYAVVNCLVIKNLSAKETAIKLGITDATVRKRFERAKKILKAMQKGCEGYETKRKI